MHKLQSFELPDVIFVQPAASFSPETARIYRMKLHVEALVCNIGALRINECCHNIVTFTLRLRLAGECLHYFELPISTRFSEVNEVFFVGTAAFGAQEKKVQAGMLST